MSSNPVTKGMDYVVTIFAQNILNDNRHVATNEILAVNVQIKGCVCTITAPTNFEANIVYQLKEQVV